MLRPRYVRVNKEAAEQVATILRVPLAKAALKQDWEEVARLWEERRWILDLAVKGAWD